MTATESSLLINMWCFYHLGLLYCTPLHLLILNMSMVKVGAWTNNHNWGCLGLVKVIGVLRGLLRNFYSPLMLLASPQLVVPDIMTCDTVPRFTMSGIVDCWALTFTTFLGSKDSFIVFCIFIFFSNWFLMPSYCGSKFIDREYVNLPLCRFTKLIHLVARVILLARLIRAWVERTLIFLCNLIGDNLFLA